MNRSILIVISMLYFTAGALGVPHSSYSCADDTSNGWRTLRCTPLTKPDGTEVLLTASQYDTIQKATILFKDHVNLLDDQNAPISVREEDEIRLAHILKKALLTLDEEILDHTPSDHFQAGDYLNGIPTYHSPPFDGIPSESSSEKVPHFLMNLCLFTNNWGTIDDFSNVLTLAATELFNTKSYKKTLDLMVLHQVLGKTDDGRLETAITALDMVRTYHKSSALPYETQIEKLKKLGRSIYMIFIEPVDLGATTLSNVLPDIHQLMQNTLAL